MIYLANKAIWILTGSVIFYWLVVFLIGPARARDATDLISMVVSASLVLTLAPHAINRLMQGGSRREWKVIIGMALFWASVFAIAAWGFAVRFYDRPDWMVESPLNGFFRYWTLGSGLLMLSALSDNVHEADEVRLYMIVAIFGLGVLTGAAGLRFLAGV